MNRKLYLSLLVSAFAMSGSAGAAAKAPLAEQPYFKQVRTTAYAVAAGGKVSQREVWEGVIITKNPSGSCTRVERTGLKFVRDGNGMLPEYVETRTVGPCPALETAANAALIGAASFAFQQAMAHVMTTAGMPVVPYPLTTN